MVLKFEVNNASSGYPLFLIEIFCIHLRIDIKVEVIEKAAHQQPLRK